MTISYESVSKRFTTDHGVSEALQALDLTVGDGQFFIFLGPSGCGKSTLLNLTAGLEAPSAGTIRFGERVVASAEKQIFVEPGDRNVAMVFQSYALYPHMRVYDNIAFPLRNARRAEPDIRPAVRRAAAMLGIDDLLGRKPGELSGGQRQRVAIARAVVRRPSVFLMDEPLSNLDAQLRTATRAELKRLQADMGVTTLYVTHDQTEAMTLGDRVALLKEGRLVQVGTPEELYRHPADPFAATFIGAPPMNLLPVRLASREGKISAQVAGFTITLPDSLIQKAETLNTRQVLLGIRPEHLRPADQGPLSGTVVQSEFLGREILYRLDLSGHELLVLTEGCDLHRGQAISLTFANDALHLFSR